MGRSPSRAPRTPEESREGGAWRQASVGSRRWYCPEAAARGPALEALSPVLPCSCKRRPSSRGCVGTAVATAAPQLLLCSRRSPRSKEDTVYVKRRKNPAGMYFNFLFFKPLFYLEGGQSRCTRCTRRQHRVSQNQAGGTARLMTAAECAPAAFLAARLGRAAAPARDRWGEGAGGRFSPGSPRARAAARRPLEPLGFRPPLTEVRQAVCCFSRTFL